VEYLILENELIAQIMMKKILRELLKMGNGK